MQEIKIVAPNGEVGYIPADQLQDALAQGARLQTPDEIKREQDEVKYGNSIGKAILYSTARGLSLGLSDQLLTKTNLVSQEELKKVKEYNEGWSTFGEITGNVIPVVASGGTGLVARALAKTPAALAASLAQRSGSKVAEKVAQKIVGDGLKQTIAKKAAEIGTAGLIEGAILGESQLVTEEALGDAEFTGEAILAAGGTGAAYGALTGGAIGAVAGAAERGLKKISGSYKKRLIEKRTDLTPEEKAELVKLVDSEDKMLNTINLTEKVGVREAAERLGLKPTIGTLSAEPAIGKLESSVGGGASLPAISIRAEREALDEGLQRTVIDVVKPETFSRAGSGEAIKQGLRDQMIADLGEAPMTYKAIFDTFGETAVDTKRLAVARDFLNEDIAARTLLKSEKSQAKELVDILTSRTDLNGVGEAKKVIGQYASQAFREGKATLGGVLEDLYKYATDLENELIESSAKKIFGRDAKALQEWMSGWNEAKSTYKAFYDKYKDFAAKELGIKAKTAQGIIDALADVKPEKLTKVFFDLNNYNKSVKLAEQFPEAFDVARRNKLNELLAESKKADGTYSLPTFLKKLDKLDETQKKLIFSSKYKQVLQDVKLVVDALPPNINPSGTDFATAWRSILSPIYQATEYGRYALYKGGAKGLRDYFNKGLPTMAAAEAAKNSVIGRIGSAAKGFFKATERAARVTPPMQMSEEQVKRAKKLLEMMDKDPSSLIEELIRGNKNLNSAMPNTAKALQSRQIAALQFLQSQFPKRDSYQLNDDYQPSRLDAARFNDYLLAIEKPFKVIDQIKDGYVNPRSLEALKVVFPKLFSKMQQDILQNMPKKLNQLQRQNLNILLGAQASPLVDKRNLMLLQGKIPNQSAQAPTKKIPATAANKLNSSGRVQSDFDRVFTRRV